MPVHVYMQYNFICAIIVLFIDNYKINMPVDFLCALIFVSQSLFCLRMAFHKSFDQCSGLLHRTLNYQKNSSLALNERLNFLYPDINEERYPLPRGLSPEDKSTNAVIAEYPLQLKYYKHVDEVDRDNGCVRADNPIPLTVGLYYFEIKILSRGLFGRAYIGLTTFGTDLHRAPGWDLETYGYHGDDGKKFSGQPWGTKYGPVFEVNDVVGCGVNFENQTCFFTLNGKFLGIAFRDIPISTFYPTVGIGSDNELIEVNFGQTPFIYNIKMEMVLNESHAKDLKMKRKQSIKRNLR